SQLGVPITTLFVVDILFLFAYEEFEDSNIKVEEEFEEDPEEDFKEELEANTKEDVLPVATPPVGSPITPLSVLESSSDSEAATPVTANGTHWMPPTGSTFEVGGPLSVSSLPPPPFYGRELKKLRDDTEILFSNVKYLERSEKKRQTKIDANSFGVHTIERRMDAFDEDLGHEV
ncbi:hypothetical protein Tco_0678160, partial [Tanacetum coccineum]